MKYDRESECPFLRFAANERDESAKNKWRIMRTRREARANRGVDWKVVDGERKKTEVITATVEETRGGKMKEEKTAKLNGCDPSRVCGRGCSERADACT